MEQVAQEVGYMFSGLFVAAVSATVTGLLGFLPGRSFRFRLLLIAAMLVAAVVGASLVGLGTGMAFRNVVSEPDGYITDKEATLGLYLHIACELAVLLLIVPVAYVIRCRLSRTG